MARDTDRSGSRRPGTHHPRLARERALKVLFQADLRSTDPLVLLERLGGTRGALDLVDELEPDAEQVAGDEALQVELARRGRLPLDDYTRTLVEGVAVRRGAIDRLLGDVAEHWAVDRMPLVDRNILRLATYELAQQDTPHAVVIDEALALAGGFAGERSRPFVNGVLETIRQRVVAGEVTLDADPVPAVAPASPPPPAGDGPTSSGVGPASADDPTPADDPASADDPTSPDDDVADRAPADAPTVVDGPSDPAADDAWDEALGLLADLDADADAAPHPDAPDH